MAYTNEELKQIEEIGLTYMLSMTINGLIASGKTEDMVLDLVRITFEKRREINEVKGD